MMSQGKTHWKDPPGSSVRAIHLERPPKFQLTALKVVFPGEMPTEKRERPSGVLFKGNSPGTSLIVHSLVLAINFIK